MLVNVCDVLENTPIENLYTELNQVMDVDRALWFLAAENVFADDDGIYIRAKWITISFMKRRLVEWYR